MLGISRLLADSQHHILLQFFRTSAFSLRLPKPMIRANSTTGSSSRILRLTVGHGWLRFLSERTRAHPSPSHKPAAQAISASVAV